MPTPPSERNVDQLIQLFEEVGESLSYLLGVGEQGNT